MHKFIEAAVLAAVGVLVFASLLIPVVNEATATTDTFTNDGYFKLTKYPETEKITIDWDYETPKIVTINDVNYDFSSYTVPLTFAFTENVGVRIFWNQSGVQVMRDIGTMAADVAESETLNVIFENGTVTATLSKVGADDVINTTTYDTPIYCISNTGDYVMKKSNELAYMLNDTEFIGLGITSITGGGAKSLLVKGTIEDGATVTNITTSGTAVTFTDPIIASNTVGGYVNLNQLDKITFKGQVAGNPDTNITYSYFVVPEIVTAEKAIHADDSTRDVLAILPLILIVGLVMGLVGYAVYSRIE